MNIICIKGLELLENALDNLSLQKDKKCNEPRYAFRKVAKKDYCEVESDESGETGFYLIWIYCQLNVVEFAFCQWYCRSIFCSKKFKTLQIIIAFISDYWKPVSSVFNILMFQNIKFLDYVNLS